MEEATLHVGGSQCHEQIVPEIYRCWGGRASIETYRQYLAEIDTYPWARRRIRNLTLQDSDGACLSSLCLHTVRALHHDQTVRLGGIARVITPEPHRGEGHASRLIGATLDLLTREGYDGAYLFSDIDPRYYERFGFATANSFQIDLLLDALPATESVPGVRPIRDADWEIIRKIHEDAARGEVLWLLREPDHWDYLLQRPFCYSRHTQIGDPQPLHSVIERQGRIIGYALALTESNALQLLELILRSPEDGAAFDALLGSLRAKAEARGCTRFSGPWPPGKWQDLYGAHFDPVERSSGILMVRSLSPRLDRQAVVEGCRGSWHTDHI